MFDACAKLCPAGLQRIEEGVIDLLDVNATILNGLYALCEFGQYGRSLVNFMDQQPRT
jgi:hypothetical protein